VLSSSCISRSYARSSSRLSKDLSEGTTGLFTVLTQKGVRQAYIGRQLLSAFVAEQLGEEGPNFVDEVNLEADKMARQYVGMFHGQLLGFPSSSHSCQYLFGLTPSGKLL
jgi:hypothetical protein